MCEFATGIVLHNIKGSPGNLDINSLYVFPLDKSHYTTTTQIDSKDLILLIVSILVWSNPFSRYIFIYNHLVGLNV